MSALEKLLFSSFDAKLRAEALAELSVLRASEAELSALKEAIKIAYWGQGITELEQYEEVLAKILGHKPFCMALAFHPKACDCGGVSK